MTSPTRPVDPYMLDVLRRFWRANRRMPTYSEMTRLFGYRSKNAAFRLAKKLVDEGYVEKDEGGRLMPRGERLGIPMLGYVQASFMLQVSGDSMIDAGIHEGDVVIVEKGSHPKNGDVVLACVDNEWTLKYYQRRGKEVELVPANKNYPVIKPKNELTLGGVVKSMIRRYF
jgi:SOS-response transcriptional repressor LexA